MCGHDVGNPRARYVGIPRMIPDLRTRQPRDGQMKCGTQSANISMINRRKSFRASRSPSGVMERPKPSNRKPSADPRVLRSRLLTARGHISVRKNPFLEVTPNWPPRIRNVYK